MRRVLAIFLDGYEHSLGQRLMSAGEMPEMSKLAASSASYLLDHGPAQRTGLAGEHLATGLSPEMTRRWSAVSFDPKSYSVWQEGTSLRPFAADLQCRTVVFDAPYLNLDAAPGVRGIVSWGAHDPGVRRCSRPSELVEEFLARFGDYPAPKWIYGLAWPSAEKSHAMGDGLARAVDVRAEAAQWLLGEKFPDWDLALVAVSEPHSVIEGLWHGVDPTHPLYGLPAATAAGDSVRAVYRGVDRLVGKLVSAFPDAIPVVFAMGGMGPNQSDVASMLLLPELMYRHAFGSAFFQQPPDWPWSTNACPLLAEDDDSWEGRIAQHFPSVPDPWLQSVASRVLPRTVKAMLRRALSTKAEPGNTSRSSLSWMPATAYRRFWHSMPAFALPSFYDGRVRINLRKREHRGNVELADYKRTLTGVEDLIRACRDPATGESAVDFVEYPASSDPRGLTPSGSDLNVIWKGAPLCLEHPTLGRIGPVPYRRTGGHTGECGVAYIRTGSGLVGEHGMHSAFDVVPTIVHLLGERTGRSLAGTSLLSDAPAGTALADVDTSIKAVVT